MRDVGATFHSGDRPALLNPDWSGLAVLGEHDIVAYGDSAPAARLAELAQDWVARGAPRLTDWQVEVDGDSPLAIAKRQTRLAFTA